MCKIFAKYNHDKSYDKAWGKIHKLRKDIDRLFDRLWDDFGMPVATRVERETPSIDLSETEETLIIRAGSGN